MVDNLLKSFFEKKKKKDMREQPRSVQESRVQHIQKPCRWTCLPISLPWEQRYSHDLFLYSTIKSVFYMWASLNLITITNKHVPQFLEWHSDWSQCKWSHLLLCLVWTSWWRVLYHPLLGFVPCIHGHMFRRRWIRGCCTLKEQSDGLRPVWHDTGA